MPTLLANGGFPGAEEKRPLSARGVVAASEEASQLCSEDILEELGRMLADDLFTRSERLSRFLRFIVEQALEGRAGELNQYGVGLAVFDKAPSFDPSIDPIVRVEAGRLRAKLREYYATSGQMDPVRIGMAKSGYRPTFRRLTQHPAPLGRQAVSGQANEMRRLSPPLYPRSLRSRDKVFSIAVLPFSNLSHDAASNQFCRDLSDRMSKELARLTSFAVCVVTPIIDAAGKGPEISEIREKYGADVVLEGSLQTVRKHIRIFSMLARTADAYGIWAENYDGSFDDLCSPQSKTLRAIAEDVAKVLESEQVRAPVA